MNSLKDKMTFQEWMQASPEWPKEDPEWLLKKRQEAYARFQALGFPTRSHEAWKYIYLEPLLNGSFVPSPKASKLPVFEGIETLFGLKTVSEQNPFVSLNTVHFREGHFLQVPKGVSLEKPVHLHFDDGIPPPLSSPVERGRKEGVSFFPRILISMEENSQAEVILHFKGLKDERYFNNAVVEIHLAAGSKLSLVNIQQESMSAISFLSTRVQIAHHACFEAVNLVLGGSITRNEVVMELMGEEAYGSSDGLTVLSNHSQAFHHVLVNHQIPHGTSRQIYKNILGGKSQVEFNSMVHVWRDAAKSNSEQMDKNLLLSNEARIYSRPQLRIDNDDVQASHGAATGQLQESEIFYLQSRGLDKETAQFVLMQGFAEEILQKVKSPTLRKDLSKAVLAELRRMSAGVRNS